jgi:uncharacterized membrane protein YbhN (UPF0104 family)
MNARDALIAPNPRVKQLALWAALLIFVGGLVVSVMEYPDLLSSLNWGPVLLVAAIGVPLTMLFNALEFSVTARLLGRRVPFIRALKITIVGTAANMLPLPGATMVRIAGLKDAGASYGQGILVSMLVILAWLAISLAYSGGWLAVGGQVPLGLVMLCAGLVLLPVVMVWGRKLCRGWVTPAKVVLIRAALVLIDAAQLYFCLAAIGQSPSFVQASALTVTAVLGAGVSIVPAGLGVRETIAAAMGPVIGLAPSGAFLAAAASRIIGLAPVACMSIVLISEKSLRNAPVLRK